jgi:alkanesulfonate monooxygenase SsuD/methylene tetrahydromethanopterin reductase-like flavin-dependent oxidoreductase (luciferase family)
MRFGLLCSAQAGNSELGPETGQGFRDYLDFNVEAETLGYHSSFLVEHHFTGWDQVSATLMLLTCLAMRTTTLRLGTAVMVLPWHNPVLLGKSGSHVLAYANTVGATEANALYGTPDEICAMLNVLNKAGAEYVLLTISGGKEQLQRFAREIMPEFSNL